VKVCHIVTRLNVGGIARFLETARGAVDCLIAGSVEPDEAEAPWVGDVIRIPELSRAVRPLRDRHALEALSRELERLRPDVVHTHASKAGALGRVAAAQLGIPAVHTFHGHVLSGYFGPVRSRLYRMVEKHLARRSHLTATGPTTAAELEPMLGAPVEVVAPGVELPTPDPAARDRWRHEWGNPDRVALMVGRSAAVKQPERFVEAARAQGFLPVVAGAHDVRGALCLGVVSRIEEIYAAADVVVCTSRREGTPYAVLEAMWSGRPVVAHPVGDVEWILGGAGGATWDIAGALEALRDPDRRRVAGDRAAAEVRRRFPAAALAPRLRALYGRIV